MHERLSRHKQWRDTKGIKGARIIVSNNKENPNSITPKQFKELVGITSDLSGIKFIKVELNSFVFKDSDFSFTEFDGVNFINCSFINCDFCYAVFSTCETFMSTFNNCQMKLIRICRTKIQSTSIVKSNLMGSKVEFSSLKSSDLDIRAKGILIESNKIQYCDFNRSKMKNSSIMDNLFFHSRLCFVDAKNSCITGNTFDNTELDNSDFKKSTFEYNTISNDSSINESDFRFCSIDYNSFPLSCGFTRVKFSKRHIRQLLYHIYKQECNSKEFAEIKELIKPYVQKWRGLKEHDLELD